MSIGEIALEAFKALVPPKTNDLEEQQRWRWVVFAAILAMAASLSLHIAISCGYIPGQSGFALASDQKSVQRRVDVIVTISLEHEIRAKTAELCHEKDPSRRSDLNDDIAKLQKEYYEVERQWYNVPGCDKL